MVMVWVRYGVDCDASTGLLFSLRLCASFSSSLSRLTIFHDDLFQDDLFPGKPFSRPTLKVDFFALVLALACGMVKCSWRDSASESKNYTSRAKRQFDLKPNCNQALGALDLLSSVNQ